MAFSFLLQSVRSLQCFVPSFDVNLTSCLPSLSRNDRWEIYNEGLEEWREPFVMTLELAIFLTIPFSRSDSLASAGSIGGARKSRSSARGRPKGWLPWRHAVGRRGGPQKRHANAGDYDQALRQEPGKGGCQGKLPLRR